MKIVSDVSMVLVQGDGVILVLLDLSAAFDTVDHSILLDRLHSWFGISGVALQDVFSATTHRLL